MASLPLALNMFVTPSTVLRLMGVEPPSEALPLTVHCPFCRRPRLTFYEDTILGGAWHYCFHCQRAGDSIDLLSAVWDMSTQGTVERLVREGIPLPATATTPEAVSRYITAGPHQWRSAEMFWKQCKEYYATQRKSRQLNILREAFRLYSDAVGKLWKDGPGRFLGASHLSNANATLTHGPLDPVFPQKTRPWKDALVLPFNDVPGRICGFWLAARSGDVNKGDVVYRTMAYGTRKRVEAGLYGAWAVDESGLPYGNRVIAVWCPAMAARLQIRWLNVNQKPMPLVAWHDSGKYRTGLSAWQALLPGRQLVFWCLDLDAATLHQAILADGDVSIIRLDYGTTPQQVDHYVRLHQPHDLGRKIIKFARPWREALSSWALGAEFGQVEDLLLALERYGHHRPDICRHDAAMTALHCKDRKYARVVWIKNVGRIMEYQGQWWSARKNERPAVLMNAILRITGVNLHDNNAPYYVGTVLFRDEEIPFEVSLRDLSDVPRRTLIGIVARKGGVLYIAPGHGRALITAALAFSNPAGL